MAARLLYSMRRSFELRMRVSEKLAHALRNHVLQLLQRTNLHYVAGWLGFEDCLFLREWIDTLSFLRRGLVLHNDLAETRDREALGAAAADGLLDLIIQCVEHVADVSLGQAGG